MSNSNVQWSDSDLTDKHQDKDDFDSLSEQSVSDEDK